MRDFKEDPQIRNFTHKTRKKQSVGVNQEVVSEINKNKKSKQKGK